MAQWFYSELLVAICNEEMTNTRWRMGYLSGNYPYLLSSAGTLHTFEMLPASSSDVVSHMCSIPQSLSAYIVLHIHK